MIPQQIIPVIKYEISNSALSGNMEKLLTDA